MAKGWRIWGTLAGLGQFHPLVSLPPRWQPHPAWDHATCLWVPARRQRPVSLHRSPSPPVCSFGRGSPWEPPPLPIPQCSPRHRPPAPTAHSPLRTYAAFLAGQRFRRPRQAREVGTVVLPAVGRCPDPRTATPRVGRAVCGTRGCGGAGLAGRPGPWRGPRRTGVAAGSRASSSPPAGLCPVETCAGCGSVLRPPGGGAARRRAPAALPSLAARRRCPVTPRGHAVLAVEAAVCSKALRLLGSPRSGLGA